MMKYSESEIFTKVKRILSDKHQCDNISMDTYLENDGASFLDMSSLEIVEFIVSLENEFDIIIGFEDRFYTVGDAVRGIIKYLDEKNTEII